MNKKVAVVGIAVALVLGLGGAAFAFFTTTGTGTGSAPIGDAANLSVTLGTITGGSLFPTAFFDANAVVDTVPYTVANTGDGNVNLTTVVMEVTPGFSFTDAAGDPACTAADFSINGQAVGTPAIAAPDVTLLGLTDAPANAYDGSFTLQMVDSGLNQDSCQSGSVPLTVIANPSTSPTNPNLSLDTPPPSGSAGWYPNPTFVSVPTVTVGEAGVSLTVTAIQPNAVNADGTFTLTYDNTFLTFTGTSADGICTTPTVAGDVTTVSCSFTDISHGDTSKPFNFTTLQAGETVVTAVVSITGSGTAAETFPLIIS
jgi:hypothetical protein